MAWALWRALHNINVWKVQKKHTLYIVWSFSCAVGQTATPSSITSKAHISNQAQYNKDNYTVCMVD